MRLEELVRIPLEELKPDDQVASVCQYRDYIVIVTIRGVIFRVNLKDD